MDVHLSDDYSDEPEVAAWISDEWLTSDAREVERGVPSPVEVGFGERLGKYKSSELLNTIYGQLAVMRWGLKRDGGSAREGR